ncbi:hypothetical protein J2J97_32095 (plasmid) [Rhizobium bangladeshense]|uniref:hypothetical protein n=1 Tax=Rhizobium bangladeshense TaxID=1138189 RepID=UPI001A986106|nr:hypothetical protein [Rhizobium bangladeshense]QSY98548.1 hypothetical protein J2J97_32095 [Rhizobium bangladeshense]
MSYQGIRATDTAIERRPLPVGADPALHVRSFQPGLTLIMDDGTRWFHPYDGTAPWRLPNARALELDA